MEPLERESARSGPAGRPKERVLWNAVAITLARILSSAFHVLAALKMARFLDKREWGLFGFLHASIDIFRVLTNFGLDVVSIRTMAVDRDAPREITNHLLLLKTALVGLAMVLIAGFALLTPRLGDNLNLLMILAASLFPAAFAGTVIVRFQAEHSMDRLILVQFLAGGLYLACIYLSAHFGFRVGGFILVFAAYEICLLGMTVVAYRRTWRGERGVFSLRGLRIDLARKLFLQALPVGLLMVVVIIYSRMGIFLLERSHGISSVGQYFIAMKISEPLLQIGAALGTSTFPVLSRLVDARRWDDLKRRFLLYSFRSALFSCAIAGLVTLFAPWVLGLIKPEYTAASGALIALAWATVCMFQSQITVTVTNSFEKYWYVTLIALGNLIVYSILSFNLIPRHGTTGAGLSTLGTEGSNMIIHIVVALWLIRRARARA